MNLSVNGQSEIPPGFRFHPTEEELLHYYLKKKVACEKIDLDVIRDVDLNKLEPWDIQEKCKLGSTPQNDWYFFSHKDKKYPTGSRTNRATSVGFWKATGRDKAIYSSFKRIGMRKTLVFYKGRAPHGQKSDWIMHEYRLDESTRDKRIADINPAGENLIPEEGWVVCRVFKKKNYHYKTLEPSQMTKMPPISMDPHKLDQILEYMGRSCKHENYNSSSDLPLLLENNNPKPLDDENKCLLFQENSFSMEKLLMESDYPTTTHKSDWASYDRLVALQLNGGNEIMYDNTPNNGDQDLCFPMDYDDDTKNGQLPNKQVEIYGGDDDHVDMWSFSTTNQSLSPTSVSCDPLGHLSV